MSWNCGDKSGLISIGTHSLFLTAAGINRKTLNNGSLQPAILIEAGLGSSHKEWVAVIQRIALRSRVYAYDRAGYGSSQPSPTLNYTAETRVHELFMMLQVANIEPPFILIGHSYGGVLVREFFLQYPQMVAGIILVDSPWARRPLPTDWTILLGTSTYSSVVGLDENHVLSDEEYKAIRSDEEFNTPTATIEEQYIELSTQRVNKFLSKPFPIMGNIPLSVIFAGESADFRKVYNYGVKHGLGRERAQRDLAGWLEEMECVEESDQKILLTLSGNGRFNCAMGEAKTHNLQYVKPELICKEVFWMLGLDV